MGRAYQVGRMRKEVMRMVRKRWVGMKRADIIAALLALMRMVLDVRREGW